MPPVAPRLPQFLAQPCRAEPGQPLALRGVVVLPWPSGDAELLADGVVELQGGRVQTVRLARAGDPLWQPHLLIPGFVDLHCHWPQHHVRGQFGGQLLEWLRGSIWPAEAALADPALAGQLAERFVRDLLRAGTCAGLFFGPPSAAASARFAESAPPGLLEGPALMEVEAPAELCQPVTETLAALPRLAAARGGPVAITPRFAPNLTDAGLRAAGQLAAQTGWPVQSHLAENRDEVAWVAQLFPSDRDYTGVYEARGLLGRRAIYAHAIHLSDQELETLAASGSWVAHCPTSNEALASGRMPLERLRAAHVPWVLASDVGAGPRLSLLDVGRAFLHVHRGHTPVTAVEALCRSTAVPGAYLSQFNAEWTGLGTFRSGAPGHVVALPLPAAPLSPEALLMALYQQTLPERSETAPLQVWCWGQPVCPPPAFGTDS